MAVTVKSTRKAVVIGWEPLGSGDVGGGTPPPEFPEFPVDPDYGVEEGGQPTHPIYLPPYLDNSLPGNQPGIDNTLPGDQPRPDNTLPGDQPVATPYGGKQIAVQVFAQGQEGDWSNTAVMPNDGEAAIHYPQDFTGESYVEIRALDGTVVDAGTVTVE